MVTYKKNVNERKKFHVKFKLVYKKKNVTKGKYIICYANDKRLISLTKDSFILRKHKPIFKRQGYEQITYRRANSKG